MNNPVMSEENIRENYERIERWLSHPSPGDEVIISGVAARLPKCKDINEFKEGLYCKADMFTHINRRYGKLPINIPQRSGQILEINKFDCGYFGIDKEVAHVMDPACRMQLEAAIEAIFDAGFNPVELEGTKTGVFIATGHGENQPVWFRDDLKKKHTLLGATRSMMAHRISLQLKLNGPSCSMDSACSGAMYALHDAYNLIRLGIIDAAVIGGVNIILNPSTTIGFTKVGVLSPDATCKVFDENANGYVRSDGGGAILIQKAKDCRRMYAKIVHAAVNCGGYGDLGIMHPVEEAQKELVKDFYEHCGIPPSSVEFLEAHGTGTTVGDTVEIQPIDEIFGCGRADALLMGSVKSNIGHAEWAAALNQILKSILIMETGLIPPNLNITKPLSVESIQTRKIQIPTEVTPFKGISGRIAINSFGFGGANGHCLLEWNQNKKFNVSMSVDPLPRLVCVSGRCMESVTTTLDHALYNRLDSEFLALLHQIYKYTSPLDVYKGFSIITRSGEINRCIFLSNVGKPPIILAFGGRHIKHLNIKDHLLDLHPFRNIIDRMDEILSSNGIFLWNIMKSEVLSSGILVTTIIQMATYTIFQELGLECEPRVVSGSGEVAYAYATKSLDMKEALLLAATIEILQSTKTNGNNSTRCIFNNGYSTKNITSFINNVRDKLSGNVIDRVLHNSPLQTSTAFMETLPSSCVILDFERNTRPLKTNSIDDQDAEVLHFNLDFEDGIISFLHVIGSLYQMGHNPDVAKLYTPVKFPVSRGTPMISPLIKWEHGEDYFVLSFRPEDHPKVFCLKFAVDPKDSEWSFVKGHIVDGRNLFPATGYLFLVWKMFAILKRTFYGDMRIVFENIKFIRATTLTDETTELMVSIQPNSGHFEVIESDSIVARGKIRTANTTDKNIGVENIKAKALNTTTLLNGDIYKELRVRGYHYSGLFKGIEEFYPEQLLGYIPWIDENWIVYMDLMMQTYLLLIETRNLYVPTQIERVYIDAPKHLEFVSKHNKQPVRLNENTRSVQSGFIHMEFFNGSILPRRNILAEPVLEKYEFVPNETTICLKESIRINMQIILENCMTVKMQVVELIDTEACEDSLASLVLQELSNFPLLQPDVRVMSPSSLSMQNVKLENEALSSLNSVSVIVAQKLLTSSKVLEQASACLSEKGFIISREAFDFDLEHRIDKNMEILTIHSIPGEKCVLLRRKKQNVKPQVIDMSQSAANFDWLEPIKNAVKNEKSVILYAEKDQFNGILGFTNCLRKEPGGENVRCIFVQDKSAPPFRLNERFYENVLRKGLTFNVYKNGKWGTYRHLKLPDTFHKADENCFVNTTVSGDLSSLAWIQKPQNHELQTDLENELVAVYYSALNFKDIMLATNKLSPIFLDGQKEEECFQGFEFAGRNKRGERVMGMSNYGSLATFSLTSKYLTLPVPSEWTLEDAATVPLVYATVLYAFSRTKIRKGDSILIHAGAGGIGQAAINIALHYGLRVFVTVGTQEKREYIKKRYPLIKDNHIGNSRDTSFERFVRKETKGKGVDIILNSLADDKQATSLRCLAYGGIFLEIGKYDLVENTPLNLSLLKKNCEFHGVSLDKFCNADTHHQKSVLALVREGISSGCVKPLERTCFNDQEIEKAYRIMAAGKHTGKMLIKIRDEEYERTIKVPENKFFGALPRYYCYPQYTYIITGGLGGFGLELADWLVSRGARRLVLVSRVGVKTGFQHYRIRKWRANGCIVRISSVEIKTEEGCKLLLKEAEDLAPVAAIFNLAAVLKDALLENQDIDSFCSCLDPKAMSVLFLDKLSRRLCVKLRDFVVFSSLTSGRGTAGQTNYGMANSIMERICEKRRDDNLPALAIQWGPIGDVGLVAEMQKEGQELEIGGTLQQKIWSCLAVLDRFMIEGNTIVSSMIVAEERSTGLTSNNLVEAIANKLGIKDTKMVSMHATLPELGMDSMMTNEIKQYLERTKEIFLSATETRNLTFARLHQIMSEKDNGPKHEANVSSDKGCAPVDQLNLANAHTPVIQLSSKTNKMGPSLLLLPGIESRLSDFNSVIALLSANSWGLNYSSDVKNDTIEKEANTCLTVIKTFPPTSKHFNIVAYSYGCLIALELVARLEREDYLGKIILIDGSPKMTSALLSSRISDNQGVDMELRILETILTNMTGNVHNFSDSQQPLDIDEIINAALDLLPPNTFSPDSLKQIIRDILRRLVAVKQYSPSFYKIKSQVYLFKPKISAVPVEEEDYCLSELAELPIVIRYFEGNHLSMLDDPQLGEAINQYLQEGTP